MPDLQPTQIVSVSLEVQQWNVIVGQLMEGPYKTMAPLIGSIIAQHAKVQQQEQNAVPADVAAKAAQAGLQQGPRLVVAEGPPPGIGPLTAQPDRQQGSEGHGDNSGEAPSAAE